MNKGIKWLGLIILMVLTLASFAPLLGLVASIAVANALGCQVDEGSAHSCYLRGTDIGGLLNDGFVLGWVMFVTWPGMLLTAAAWIVLAVRSARRPVQQKMPRKS